MGKPANALRAVPILIVMLLVSGGLYPVVVRPPSSSVGEGYLGFGPRSSHHGLFRAALHGAPELRPGMAMDLTLQVEGRDGTPVDGARIRFEPWMPEDGQIQGEAARVRRIAPGRYAVEGVRLERAGWWNFRVSIESPGGVDSLAFNLVLPGRADRSAGPP